MTEDKQYPKEYEPIGCKDWPDIRDCLGNIVTRKLERSEYNRRTQRIESVEY